MTLGSNSEDLWQERARHEPIGHRSTALTSGGRQFRSGGLGRVLAGFALGAVFTYFALGYFDEHSAGRGVDQAALTGGASAARASASGLRMTYELARLPDAATAAAAHTKRGASEKPPAAATPTAPGPIAEPPTPGERVINARPITTVPPDARDTTREIGREAQTTRNKGRAPSGPEASLSPGKRHVEGREVQLSSEPAEVPPPARRDLQKKAAAPPPPSTRATGSPQTPHTANGAGTAPGESVAPVEAPAPPVNDGASLRSPAGSADIVELRLEATRAWPASSPLTTHTIQLLGTPGETQLKNQLQFLSKVLDPNRLYVFRTVAQFKPTLTVVYGSYADRQSAQEALSGLPSAAAAYQPVLRTVNGIRSELKQHGREL
jgi:septal ring-binding cell division protein DamX